MTWIDGHLDLACLALEGRELRRPCPDPAAGCISLPDLRDAGIDLAFATIFTAPDDDGPEGYPRDDAAAAYAAGVTQLELYETLEREGELAIVRSRADLDRAGPAPKVVILMEGADPITGPDDVADWHERGLRLVGLTWGSGTRYAGGNASGGPLTAAGVDLVRALDAAGIVHDASHLSDEAFDGVMQHARGRVVASHSNCRVLVEENQRHLRDDQVRAIGERSGIVGLNLYTRFLVLGQRATVDDCVAHVARVAEIMGRRDGVALGSDADGGFGPEALPVGLEHPAKWDELASALEREGWSETEVAGFRTGNWRCLLEDVLPEE